MGLDLTEAAINEFYGMIGDLGSELGRINKTLENVALALDRIAHTSNKGTDGEFRSLVGKMRDSQREYFRTKGKDSLIRSKQLEKQVDEILSGQAGIFDGLKGGEA